MRRPEWRRSYFWSEASSKSVCEPLGVVSGVNWDTIDGRVSSGVIEDISVSSSFPSFSLVSSRMADTTPGNSTSCQG